MNVPLTPPLPGAAALSFVDSSTRKKGGRVAAFHITAQPQPLQPGTRPAYGKSNK